MEVLISQEQGRVPVTVFRLKGDLREDERLETLVRKSFEAGTRHMLMDLTEVPHVSSRGLRILHQTYTLLRSDARDVSDEAMKRGLSDGTYKSPNLKLLNPSEAVMKVLRLVGYDMFIEIHYNFKEAIASF